MKDLQHDYRLMTFDPRAIQHVLSDTAFEKPWQTRSFMSRLIGRGVRNALWNISYSLNIYFLGIFSMEGKEHDMQRKIVHSAFTPRSVKNMTPIFFQKAEELQECWKNILDEHISPQTKTSPSASMLAGPVAETVIDVAHWISRASFDIIGLTGFNYDFHSIRDESEPVYTAYRRMFNIADKGLNLRQILDLYFPILRTIWVTLFYKVA